MPFHFPFLDNFKNTQKRKQSALEQAEQRSRQIRQAPVRPSLNKPQSGTDPRSVLEQFQGQQRLRDKADIVDKTEERAGLENHRRLREAQPTPQNAVDRREDFFGALGSLNPLDRIADAVGQRQQNEDEKLKSAQRRELSKIRVIAFVGSSGTGKSTRALKVANLRRIQYFIDDGLLIEGGRIVAGSSAKRAGTKIESVRQAIFYDDSRAANLRRTLLEKKPDRLMILGTSDGMILKICNNLWLQPPVETIRIEDVSSPEERREAKTTRMTQGSHTIPVPSMEIKHEFSGYFQDPLKLLRRRRDRDKATVNYPESERTVVRPTFSSMGAYLITDEALAALIRLLVRDVKGLATVSRVRIQKEVHGAILGVELSLYYGYNAQEVMLEVQQILLEQVENYTSINVLSVSVSCRKVVDPRAKARVAANRVYAAN
ncbi:MAG: Asp23/Gls24 family envelope stress response protein [Clostridia bacterium]|nr:Asp23/Gls24 family envelope stress response protein [Clostridia bacterium]NLF20623.1 Asp23/Gls24 family envelope stress response protein [Clostridiaceae bacterium]